MKRCKACENWFNEVIDMTSKIDNEDIRDNLTHIWYTLRTNNSRDFDIIAHTFDPYKFNHVISVRRS